MAFFYRTLLPVLLLFFSITPLHADKPKPVPVKVAEVKKKQAPTKAAEPKKKQVVSPLQRSQAAQKKAVQNQKKQVAAVPKKVDTPPAPLKKTKPSSVSPVIAKQKPVAPKASITQALPKKAPASADQNVFTLPQPKIGSDKLIIIDAGHGGYDLGAKIAACNEKSLALSTALLVKKHLSDMGYRVILTRSRDIFLPLQKRTEIANQTKGKLFVSVHFNSAKSPDAKGIEIFYHDSQDKTRSASSKELARKVLTKILDRTGALSRGVKGGNFFVIRETKMPAILVEGGFITSEEERKLLIDVNYRDKLAKGIAEGIDHYFKV